jgi:hypothetical protein
MSRIAHVGYLEVVSPTSVASSMSNLSLTSTNFQWIPDYVTFSCELKFVDKRQNKQIRWDLGKNCALLNGYPQLFVKGEKGIKQINAAVKNLTNQNFNIGFNEDTGLYVHIGLYKQPYYLEDLKRICHNFLKYESCINQIMMSQNRRQQNSDCLSHRSFFPKSNLETKDMIYKCESIKDLQHLMCKNASNFKLNLMNLHTKGTLEFRQHAGALDTHKIELW